ncbi:MAG: IS5 family transposase [Fibromonadaceae bacterium]|jgi:IS5 family transposase|nr:IS5 family transposase [Fibromonadaceae bacterium]
MEKILTFADLEIRSNKKMTRREEFLGKMESIVPWQEIASLIQPCYYSNRTGRPATRLEVILRMYFLQLWFSLSDEGLEDAIYDSKAFISFMGIDISSIPDATVLCNFRNLLAANNLGGKILSLVNLKIEKNGLIMHGGTIMDATIHEAPKSTRNASQSRDPEMASTKKHGNYHFGAKSHIGVDAGTGLVHSVEVTPANAHDITVAHKLIRPDDHCAKGDSGYVGLEKRDPFLSRVKCEMVKRPHMWKKLGELAKSFDRQDERRLISARQKVEYVFHVLKDIFKFRKLPYKGLAKNAERLLAAFANVNLYMLAIAGRRFCPLLG